MGMSLENIDSRWCETILKNKLFGWLELVLFLGCQKISEEKSVTLHEDPGEMEYENMKSASNKV